MNWRLGFICFLALGCSEALPKREPTQVALSAWERVDHVSHRTRRYLEQVREERAISERLLHEAREILAEVRRSELMCRAAPSPRSARRIAVRRPAPPTHTEALPVETPMHSTATPAAMVPSTTAPPDAKPTPEYSPSDAPNMPLPQLAPMGRQYGK